jgi:hypothetical protein
MVGWSTGPPAVETTLEGIQSHKLGIQLNEFEPDGDGGNKWRSRFFVQ